MYCCNCGKEIPEGSSFCPACGVSVQKPEQNANSEAGVKNKNNAEMFRRIGFLALATGIFWICYIVLNSISSMVIYIAGDDHTVAFCTIKPIIFKLLLILSLSGFIVASLILTFTKKKIWLICILVLFALGSLGTAYMLVFHRVIIHMLHVSEPLFEYADQQLEYASIMCGISILALLGGLYLCTRKSQLSAVFRNMAIIAGLFIVVSVPSAILAIYGLHMGVPGGFIFITLSAIICFVVSLILNKEKLS